MSEAVESYRAIHEHWQRLRAKFGIECPVCKEQCPRANASILLPQQRCRVDGYRDPRPELTDEQWGSA